MTAPDLRSCGDAWTHTVDGPFLVCNRVPNHGGAHSTERDPSRDGITWTYGPRRRRGLSFRWLLACGLAGVAMAVALPSGASWTPQHWAGVAILAVALNIANGGRR